MRVSRFAVSFVGLLLVSTIAAQTQSKATPDFSGVYYPINPFGPPTAPGGPPQDSVTKAGPPPKPTRSAPLSDGSLGRAPGAPSLTPEYMAKWQVIAKSRQAGSAEYDYAAKCLSPGMPAIMNMFYGMEVMQTKDKITFFSEMNDALRRVYLDGRKPTQAHLDDPSYSGYSTGHWEGDTLVVDTVAIHPQTFIEGFTPHSDQLTVHERIRLAEPTLLVDEITVNDPIALTKSWSTTKRYRKATAKGYGKDELREFACPEGLAEAK
jgi:hypothetical protein